MSLRNFACTVPIAGIGVVVAYDPEEDEYGDVSMSLDEARAAVRWGRRGRAETRRGRGGRGYLHDHQEGAVTDKALSSLTSIGTLAETRDELGAITPGSCFVTALAAAPVIEAN